MTPSKPIDFPIADNAQIEPISSTNIPPAIANCFRFIGNVEIALPNNHIAGEIKPIANTAL